MSPSCEHPDAGCHASRTNMNQYSRVLVALVFTLVMCNSDSSRESVHVESDPLQWYLNFTKRSIEKMTQSMKGAHNAMKIRAEELSHRNDDDHTIERGIYYAADRLGESLAVPPEAVIDANMRNVAQNVAKLSRAMSRIARDQQEIFDEMRLHYPLISSHVRPAARCIDPVRAGDPNHDACTEIHEVMTKLPPSIAERFVERAERSLAKERSAKVQKHRKSNEL